MSSLLIVQGENSHQIEPTKDRIYLYRIGSATVTGHDFVDLNCSKRLNQKAEQVRDRYVQWIRELNQLFVTEGLICDNLSTFYLTDLSCKRTEIFDTFSIVVSLLFLKDALDGEEISNIQLVGVNRNFSTAIQSVFPTSTIISKKSNNTDTSRLRIIASDLRYFSEIFFIGAFNQLGKPRKSPCEDLIRRCFFSIYPSMLRHDFRDKKYGKLIEPGDAFAVAIVTDGYHQHFGIRQYYALRKKLTRKNIYIVDDYLRVKDCFVGIFWSVRFLIGGRHIVRGKKVFEDIDLTKSIEAECRISLSRASRLLALASSMRRFFRHSEIHEFIYYLHEYPIGRMISWVLGMEFPKVKRIGMQHGPASWRKLLYFLAPGEASTTPPWVSSVPVPDEVLAEDDQSAEIYRYAGYKHVSVLSKIHRLDYLESINVERRSNVCLVAPGLHDGKNMLVSMRDVISRNPEKQFLFKPHPLSDNKYLAEIKQYSNLQIVEESIAKLLSIVDSVYVTYSSVGLEARHLGLPVHVVSVPGVINQSPLND